MPERGLVSVIIPTYNRVATIERAVESVLSQRYPRVEVLVIDDGSTDGTADLMTRRYGDERRVRYLRFPNGGVCVARNRGLREARGEFVAMLDSDDYWLPGKLSLQVGILEAHRELSLVWSDMDAVDSAGQVVAPRYLRTMYGCYRYFDGPGELFERTEETGGGAVYHIGHISQALVLGNLIHTSTVVARADRLAAAGEYDQSLHPCEDQDYYYRVCRTGPVALVDVVTAHYQIGAADAATADSCAYELATSAHRVFRRLRALEGEGFRFARNKLQHAERELHRWVGVAAFHRRRMAEARKYLAKRVLQCPSDVRSLAYLTLACTPFSLSLLRILRTMLGRGRF